MSRIRGKGTGPEERVRKYLFSKGFRYRKNDVRLPGKPDAVLPKYKAVIFVNGCFWHHHEGCQYAYIPKSNTEFWMSKFETNTARDKRNYNELKKSGWRVFVVWQCELSNKKFETTMAKLIADILDPDCLGNI